LRVLESLGQHKETHHEKGDYGRVRDTRWRDAGTGRSEGRSEGSFDFGGGVGPYADGVEAPGATKKDPGGVSASAGGWCPTPTRYSVMRSTNCSASRSIGCSGA